MKTELLSIEDEMDRIGRLLLAAKMATRSVDSDEGTALYDVIEIASEKLDAVGGRIAKVRLGEVSG